MIKSSLKVRYTVTATNRRPTRRLRVTPQATKGCPRVLLLCDEQDQADRWCARLALKAEDVMRVSDWLKLTACPTALLAVVDVGAEKLAATLHSLRSNRDHDDLHILVATECVENAPQLAGVLPRYRAMACSASELKHLAQRRLQSNDAPLRREIVL